MILFLFLILFFSSKNHKRNLLDDLVHPLQNILIFLYTTSFSPASSQMSQTRQLIALLRKRFYILATISGRAGMLTSGL